MHYLSREQSCKENGLSLNHERKRTQSNYANLEPNVKDVVSLHLTAATTTTLRRLLSLGAFVCGARALDAPSARASDWGLGCPIPLVRLITYNAKECSKKIQRRVPSQPQKGSRTSVLPTCASVLLSRVSLRKLLAIPIRGRKTRLPSSSPLRLLTHPL